jgi:membrane protein insertase Oxa1/YidC/SpoIIIJ
VVNPWVNMKPAPWLVHMQSWMEIKNMNVRSPFMVVNPDLQLWMQVEMDVGFMVVHPWLKMGVVMFWQVGVIKTISMDVGCPSMVV